MTELYAKILRLMDLGKDQETAALIAEFVISWYRKRGGRGSNLILENVNQTSTKPAANVSETSSLGGKGGKGGKGGQVSGLSDPILSGPLSVKSPRKYKVMSLPAGFAEFWLVYPRHVAKGAAIKSWVRIDPTSELIQLIQSAIRRQAPEFARREPDKIPHAATWLNGRRWEDEVRTGGQLQLAKPAYQDSGKYLADRDRCEFHREPGNLDARPTELVSWCRRCQKHSPRVAGGTP